MKKFIKFVDTLSWLGGYTSGIMMIVGFVLVIIEILVRGLFVKTLYITEEYTGYLMAGVTYLALAFTLRDGAHIRMTFIFEVLSERKKLLA